MSTVKSFTLPPLSIHTQPTQRISLDQPLAKQSGPKAAPSRETRALDRDSLPSMMKAATSLEPSNLKMVAFASPEDGDQSDSSSICHSPTWDDYGRKKRKETDTKRRRLTKEPPPAAMDNRPAMNPRALSDTTLSKQHTRKSAESIRSSQIPSAQTEVPPMPLPFQGNGVESVETVARSPAFIGGVRLEREREVAMKRLINARTPSEERPASEMTLRAGQSQSTATATATATNVAQKRETAPPATAYPPTASKAPFLSKSGQPRTRRGSFGQSLFFAAGKLFGSKDKDAKNEPPVLKKNQSQTSVHTLFSPPQDRGRQMNGDTLAHSRGQSYDSHERYTSQKEERRGAVSQPPVSWKNKRRNKTTSMIAIPPDSARDGSFFPDDGQGMNKDDFGFLERPFSPLTDGPLSPPGSLPASMKAKMSPQLTPTSATSSPTWQPPSKKTFKEVLKTSFGSSPASPAAGPNRRRSGTNDTLVGTDNESTLPLDSHPLQSHPVAAAVAAKDSPASSARRARRPDEHHIGSQVNHNQTGPDAKDSGESSTSSHPDSESLPPSPMTTPETSRPQSSKDDQTPRVDDSRQAQMMSYDVNSYAMRYPGAPALGEQDSGYFSTKKGNSPRIINVEKSNGSVQEPMGRQRGPSGSVFVEDLPTGDPFLTDELWTRSKKPLDTDQLSFTSALTSLDVKRSFTDLNSAISLPLQSPNGDVTPISLDRNHNDTARATELTIRSVGMDVAQGPRPSKHPYGSDVSSRSSDTSFLPTLPHQALTPRANGRPAQALLLPGSAGSEVEQRPPSSHARTESPDSFAAQPSSKASTYLQAARKAAPSSSPRPPHSKTGSTTSLPAANTSLAGPRSFALSAPTNPKLPSSSSTVTVPSPLSAQSGSTDKLGKPIAKMLVECCHCKFYQDMPSRVYEAMARPDDIVKDKRLGVSGQVTTCVKCPWCSHNMSTICCAGYAAVVYLREKLHGP